MMQRRNLPAAKKAGGAPASTGALASSAAKKGDTKVKRPGKGKSPCSQNPVLVRGTDS